MGTNRHEGRARRWRGGVQRYTVFRYHLVWATKRRRPLITEEVEAVLYPALAAAASRHQGTPYAINGIEDHVHIGLGIEPTIGVSEFVRLVKSESSSVIRQTFPDIDFRWQRGYGGFTIDRFNCQRVLHYIRSQKHHHRRDTTIEHFEPSLDPDEREPSE